MFKKRKMYVHALLIFVFCLLLGVETQAAANPFSGVKTKSRRIFSTLGGIGCDYITPQYTKDFKLKVSSSSKKIATVESYSFVDVDDSTGKKLYRKGFWVHQQRPGTAKIKATIKIGKKTYKKTFTYYFEKYKNPFSSFKIGGKNYTSKLNKFNKTNNIYGSKNPFMKWSGILSGKLKYKLKKGYKISSISAHSRDANTGSTIWKSIKNGSEIPENCYELFISYQNTKTKAGGCIHICK